MGGRAFRPPARARPGRVSAPPAAARATEAALAHPADCEFQTPLMTPTPTAPDRTVRPADFGSIAEALDFAATGETGLNLYGPARRAARGAALSRPEGPGACAGGAPAGGGAGARRPGGPAGRDRRDFIRAFFACQYAGLAPAPLPLPAPFGGREAYVEHVRRMLRAAEASAVLGPASLSAWLVEAAEGLDLKIAGALADLPPAGAAIAPHPRRSWTPSATCSSPRAAPAFPWAWR